jgi:formylglycine-generating enzyme required for sulfatase activity/predicted Ser/Thr protein kinase
MKTCLSCQRTYPDDFSVCPHDGAHLAAQGTETEVQLAAGLSRRFRIVRRLGRGGMGTVFLAEQIGVGNRPVALKVLNRRLLDDPDFLLRFENEAASTGRIRHPNVVTIYESAQSDDGTPYIAMEFLEGESLREVLRRRGPLPVTEVAEILQQAARGLNAAHKLGIIHRDLKPDNIFLMHGDGGELVVKVVDFGIAKLRESAMHTQTGTVLGTPAYMSCEQASGMRSDELDGRSDIYSLGVVIYEMLTGRTPFQSDTPVGYLRMHMQETPPPLRAVKPGLCAPPQIETVVMKALAKDRDQRYGTVLEFAQEFAQAAEAGPHVTAHPETRRQDAKPQPQATVTPVPMTTVPAGVRDSIAAKAVTGTARPSRRKRLVTRSRWIRVGIIASVVWVLAAGIYTLKVTSDADVQRAVFIYRVCLDIHKGQDPDYQCEKNQNHYLEETTRDHWIVAAIVALVPVPLGWGLGYLVLFLMRKPVPEIAQPSRRKWLVLGSVVLLIVATVGGFWFYMSQRRRPELIRTGSGSGPAREEAKSPPAATVSAGEKPEVEAPVAGPGPAPGKARVNPKDGLRYVWIPPGTFMMGCSPGDTECGEDEKPAHQVTITRGFWIGQTPVTAGAYRRYAAATGRRMPPEAKLVDRPLNPGWANRAMPIVDVTWDDAQAYCSWAGGRLPTEGEWEYAARAGRTAARYGDLNEIAWDADNSGRQRLDSARILKEDKANYAYRLKENANSIHDVGLKRSNRFGLYDILGNAWEWVIDRYDENYYQNSPSQDPQGPTRAEVDERVLRGGSWNDPPSYVRASSRMGFNSDLPFNNIGFRCGGEVFAP